MRTILGFWAATCKQRQEPFWLLPEVQCKCRADLQFIRAAHPYPFQHRSSRNMHRGHELAMLLRKAYLTFHRRANARIIKSGITADQFVALTMLAQEEGITQVTLVERTASDPNTVTAILRLLERRGFVRREAHASDGRARCVFLTKKGRSVQRKLTREADVMLAALWKCVDQEQR